VKVFIIDPAKCNGCYNCQIACKDEHCGNDWSPIAKPQPLIGQFWCKVNEEELGRAPVVRVVYTPTLCGHCDGAPCLESAKNGAVYRRDDGLVIIDPDKAQGLKELVNTCPIGAIYYNEDLDVAQKCTGCAHLLDNGWAVPRCVDSCPTKALRFVDIKDLSAEELAATTQPDKMAKYGSHVYYVGSAKRRIAGTLADRSINEVIIGAQIIISDESGTRVSDTITDDFGDFRVTEFGKAIYTVTIEANGYQKIELSADTRTNDVVFEDIFLQRSSS
jgi:Fe-S-cluster-containing dehydrogenase component